MVALIFAVAGSDHAEGSTRASTACRQWNVTGTWESGQSNVNRVTYRFVQKHTRLSGVGKLSAADAAGAGFQSGTLSGTVKGTHIRFVVVWQRSSHDGLVHRGLYTGVVSSHHIIGQTRDLTVSDEASFAAHGPTRCVS